MNFRVAKIDETHILPNNYFCMYEVNLSDDVDWEVKIYRAMSIMYTEDIQLVLSTDQLETQYTDESLRAKSFMVEQPKDGGRNYTSHFTLGLKSRVNKVTVYVANRGNKAFQSFKIWVRKQQTTSSFGSTVYTVLATMFCMTTCVVCTAGCFRCYYNNRHINFNVDQPDPNWDDDMMRVYVIRRLERQLDTADHEAQAENLERELKRKQTENIQRYMDAMETVVYEREKTEFETTECVVCMENFSEKEQVKRVPVCRHFFHEACVKKWFESKVSESLQRCPQCNITLKTGEMTAKMEANLKSPGSNQMVLIAPKAKAYSSNDRSVSPMEKR